MINALTHPEYDDSLGDWQKFRYLHDGGRKFIEQYLKKFSVREDNTDFNNRRAITYNPAFTYASIIEIKNAILHRMQDVIRSKGSKSYMESITGLSGGVDRYGRSMNAFLSDKVLEELLFMGKVGIFVDMPSEIGRTRAENMGKKPYLYLYQTENIRNWSVNDIGEIVALVLRDYIFEYDEKFPDLPKKIVEQFRYLQKTPEGVFLTLYDKDGRRKADPIQLGISKIPFAILELNHSLQRDIVDYQIALMNVASSDISYSLKSNYPFYTEQYDPLHSGSGYLNTDYSDDNVAADTDEAEGNEVDVSPTQGRMYGKGLERPMFIHPSSEPLKASMEKQEQIKAEIRNLLSLNVSALQPVRASEASKKADEGSLESGLVTIGLCLETGEREIATLWHAYEGSKSMVHIKYPNTYSFTSEDTRRDEARELEELLDKIPSKTYKKEIAKRITSVLLGNKTEQEVLDKILKEIDQAEVLHSDVDAIATDLENGLVSTETASKIRGYPEGEVEQAKKDHEERIKRIALAQSQAPIDGGARGVDDTDPDPNKSGSEEKKNSRDNTLNDTVRDRTRGEGNG